MTPPLTTTLGWVEQGTQQLLETIDSLTPKQFEEPSLLPTWTRGHVISHLSRNAEALLNLIRWASTGVVTPMYPHPEQRAADIERGTRSGLNHAIFEFSHTARALSAGTDELNDTHWSSTVQSALGRSITTTEVPWLRAREVWLHGLDLDTGLSPYEFPEDLIAALLANVLDILSARNVTPGVSIVVVGKQPAPPAQLGLADGTDPIVVAGGAVELLCWLTGRLAAAQQAPQYIALTWTGEQALPDIGPWL